MKTFSPSDFSFSVCRLEAHLSDRLPYNPDGEASGDANEGESCLQPQPQLLHFSHKQPHQKTFISQRPTAKQQPPGVKASASTVATFPTPLSRLTSQSFLPAASFLLQCLQTSALPAYSNPYFPPAFPRGAKHSSQHNGQPRIATSFSRRSPSSPARPSRGIRPS